ncbi:MAG: VTT domain-containing protein [bacterium]|nr:VTT domain-containing protein [bacterium]
MTWLIPLIIHYRYLILFPIAAIEGPMVALVVGFLISLGYLSFIPAYIILLFGDIIPDTIYYYLGRFGNHDKLRAKYFKPESFLDRNSKIIEHLWNNHGGKTMFFSKLAYGLSIPFLISAGFVKIPLKRFLSLTIPVTIFQYGVLIAVGFYLSKSYNLAITYIKNGGLIFAGVLIIFVIGYFIFYRYAQAQIKKLES